MNRLSALLICTSCLLGAAGAARAQGAVVLRGVVHPGDGPAIPDGGVVVEGSRIVAVGPWAELAPPEGSRVLAPSGAHITPGLIDAASTAGVIDPSSWSEHEREVVPDLRVLDAIDLDHVDFRRLVRRGVTTVFVTAGPGSVVGGRGVALKTAGPTGGRVLQPAGALKANLGPEAWVRGVRNRRPGRDVDFSTRRPTTLMGAVWVFREAFALAARGELDGPQGRILREVLAGQIPLRIQARRRGEIEVALRLSQELGIGFVLEEGTEAYRVLDALASTQTPVIFGPLSEQARGYRARTGEADEPCLTTPLRLAERGIPFCLSAGDRTGEDGTWAQGMLAVRYGLGAEAALRALTSAPARILGEEVSDRVGRLAAGLDADVVVWSGAPFEATSRASLVLVGGRVEVGTLPDPTEPPEDDAEDGAEDAEDDADRGAKQPKQRFK